jgi:uncharacterized protein (UPF0335 family)
MEDFPTDDAIKYITMLTAFQVVLNCQLDLEKSVYLSGKSKQKVREAINILNLEHSKNHRAIWNIDSQKAATLMMGIEILAEEIAESNGVILSVIAELKRAGFDLSRVKIVEVSDEELKELENRKAD